MKAAWLVLVLLVPATTHADTPSSPFREQSRWERPELLLGGALVLGGYVGAVTWARQSAGDQDALYIPVIGPWLELFSLPDCGNRDVFCDQGNAATSVLLLDGVVQLVGVGLTVHALARKTEPERVLIAPLAASGTAGVSLRGRF